MAEGARVPESCSVGYLYSGRGSYLRAYLLAYLLAHLPLPCLPAYLPTDLLAVSFTVDEAFAVLSNFSFAENSAIMSVVLVLGGLHVFSTLTLGLYRQRRLDKKRKV